MPLVLGDFCGKSLKDALQLVLESHKNGIEAFFSHRRSGTYLGTGTQ